MKKLNFPSYSFKTKSKENKPFIWDAIRKKYYVLTPEEWVRQHCIQFLVEDKNYSPHFMGIEKQFIMNGLKKRTDIVVYAKDLEPYIVVECKAPSIKITQATFDQIARYNLTLNAKYLMVTNGLEHYYCQMDFENETYHFLEELPKKS